MNASIHIAHGLTRSCTSCADLGTGAALVAVKRAANQHQVGTGPAGLSAGHHQPEVLGLDVLAADLQAVLRGHAEAGLVAAQAGVDAGLHVRADDVGHGGCFDAQVCLSNPICTMWFDRGSTLCL